MIPMAEKEIALLKEQIARLDEKKFDLEAWKNRTEIFLERIFGKESPKLKMIQNLHYDYSSWTLRDTFAGGSAKDTDPARIQAKEILEATIAELESLGLPQEKKEQQKIRELLEDELTGKQMKELDSLINSEDREKTEKAAKILETLAKENLAATVAKLLTS
jgi:flagellar motility protein MotE (MotC chaperone)